MNYIFYDLETNGIDVLNNAIMQMTIIDKEGQILLNEYVYPHDGIIDATHVHGIDEKKLRENDALQLNELVVLIKKVLKEKYNREDIIWVAYNNFGFDQMVLEMSFKKINARSPENWYFMDIYPLIKERFSNIRPNYKLSSVYKFLINNKEGINYHSSLDDCMCLFELFEFCLIFEDDFKKYMRSKMGSYQIMEDKLTSLAGYNKYMEFERFNILKIGDLYEKFKKVQFNTDDFFKVLKEELNMKSDFYAHQIIKQIQCIYQLHKK